eukprot:CAMPEP_0119021354 /NCGR_PEP_ID=MMETSP1176-20130426/25811_1 /TAXON_ID=265551 /ORGANISM="Synedropsis recta cf, Strain CCMP1620" /LENGTH=448 /DNA_ID=CAMNT_0006975933 /DNA_START=52 /DNA_END=1398 /DNA_ORIENTATION=+
MRITILFACAALVQGFAPSPTSLNKVSSSQQQKQLHQLNVVAPEHVDLLMNNLHSNLLADAATAVADDPDKISWWQQYLSIFKATLIFVHSTVDEPLRSVGITQTWGISIAIFTAAMRSLLIPLSIQQNKSTEYMKALKPYITEIKEKFKDKPEAQNRAIGKLYEDAEQNPLNGCFLSLAQLPVLLGLYRGIRNLAQDGLLKESFLWIPSLEGPVTAPTFRGMEWLTQGWTTGADGTPIPQLGWETTLAFLIMPVVLVLGQSLTMSILTPPTDDESMSDDEKEQMEKSQVVLKFLPLMIGYFSLQVPAGLTIYWFTSNVFSLTQSLVIRQYYAANPPDIELPEYWDALDDMDNMSADEKRAASAAGLNVAPTFESLIEEANYHYVVQRNPLREKTDAWQRVLAAGDSADVPSELEEWVTAAVAFTAAAAAEEEEGGALPFFVTAEETA